MTHHIGCVHSGTNTCIYNRDIYENETVQHSLARFLSSMKYPQCWWLAVCKNGLDILVIAPLDD